jgi:hypothetical protein
VTSAATGVAVADTVIAMVIVVVAMAVAVVMIIAAALATTTMTDAAMADVTVMTAIAPEILIAMRAVGVMIAMEVVVIAAVTAAVTAAAIVVAVATMIEAMIGAASLLLLETIHANLTAEAAETTAAATTATQVGRLFHHMSTRDRPVSSGSRAYDSFRTQVMSPATSRFRIPICIPRFFRRLDGKLETASNSKFAAMTVAGFVLLITKATSAIAGGASLSTCTASVQAGFPSFSTIRVGGHERATYFGNSVCQMASKLFRPR